MYYLIYGFLYVLSLLPLRFLYLISDAVYELIYYVIGYRKKIVMQNLRAAFPEKTEKERIVICKKFYKNLCDTFIETIKLITASGSFIKRHFQGDSKIFDSINEQGKKCQMHVGHNFNWELAVMAVPLYCHYPYLDIYLPLNNKISDRLLLKIRSRTGTILISAHEFYKEMLPYRHLPYCISFVADQNPPDPSKAFWLNFFNRPAPFIKAPEKSAKGGNTPVVFCHIIKLRRGYYKECNKLITMSPRDLPEGKLTAMFVSYLEKVIREQPDMWLWSHRRWKHEYKKEYENLWIGN